MNFCLVFVLFGHFFAWSAGMLYRRDSHNLLKPVCDVFESILSCDSCIAYIGYAFTCRDLMAISSTVVPLPVYSVFRYENKVVMNKNKRKPQGKIELVTKNNE